MLTPAQIQQAGSMMPRSSASPPSYGSSTSAGLSGDALDSFVKGTPPPSATATTKTPVVSSALSLGKDFVNNTEAAGLSGGDSMVSAAKEGANALETNDHTLGGEVSTGAKLAGAGVDAGLAGVGTLFSPVAGLVQTLSDKASDNVHVQDFAKAISPLLDAANTGVSNLDDLAAQHPDIAKNVNRILGLATLETGDEGANAAKNAVEPATQAVKGAAKAVADTATATAKATGDIVSGGIKAVGNVPGAGLAKDVATSIPKSILDIAAKGGRRIADYVNDKRAIKDLPQPVQEAIKSSIPVPYAKMIGDATPEEKQAAEKMLDMQVKGVNDMSSKARPEGVIGARILQAVKAVTDMNKKAGTAEGEHVGDLSGQSVDHAKTTSQFVDSLDALNVHVGDDGRLDFSSSEFKGPSNAKDRGLLQSVWEELHPSDTGSTVKNARDIHTGRQALFNEIKGRPTMDPFAPKAVSIAESARKGLLHDIGDQAGAAGTGYKTQATNFAITQKALEDFYNLLGKKYTGRPEDIQGLKAGEVFNRIKGNAGSDAQYVLDTVEKLAKKGGFKSNIDPQKLIDINQLIKNVVGDTQSASLSGGVKRGVQDAMHNAAIEVGGHAASGSIPGMIKGAVKFAQGNSREEQIRALRKLLHSAPF